jgi:hypothetical protein
MEIVMRLFRLLRLLAVPFAALGLVLGMTAVAMAGSPHFVGTPVYTATSAAVTVTAKEAGLGDEPQIHVVLSGTAVCVNGGGNQPQAVNKTSFTVAADEPVQNGQSSYTLTAGLPFQPACSPPMTVRVTSVSLEDTTSGISAIPVPAP